MSDQELRDAIEANTAEELELLLQTTKWDFKRIDENDEALRWVGYDIRNAYYGFDEMRLARSKDPSLPEPPLVIELRRKAEVLRNAGAKPDIEAAVMLGWTEVVVEMLENNPRLGRATHQGSPLDDFGAWCGQWQFGDIFKKARKLAPKFSWEEATASLTEWASKAIAALDTKGKTFRRFAIDGDSYEGYAHLCFDLQGSDADGPGDYSLSAFAESDECEPWQEVAGMLQEGSAAKAKKYLEALCMVALNLEETTLESLTKTDDFEVLVFDHEEDAKAARRRMNRARKKRA